MPVIHNVFMIANCQRPSGFRSLCVVFFMELKHSEFWVVSRAVAFLWCPQGHRIHAILDCSANSMFPSRSVQSVAAVAAVVS